MKRKLIRDVDTGEVYLLPDESEAVKNTSSFMTMDNADEVFDFNESIDRNTALIELQKQLSEKDKQLKKLKQKYNKQSNSQKYKTEPEESQSTQNTFALIVCVYVIIGFGILLTLLIIAANDMPANASEVNDFRIGLLFINFICLIINCIVKVKLKKNKKG